MIKVKGYTNSELEPIVTVEILGHDGRLNSLQAVLDTGFNGDLSLSEEVIRKLDLRQTGERRVGLADGDDVKVPIFSGILSYKKRRIDITVFQMGEESLVGMELFRNGKISLEVWDGGNVTIRLP